MTASSETQSVSMLPRIRSALFEVACKEPDQAPRWVLWAVTALLLSLSIWAALAHLDIVAVAPGRLVPQTYVKIVQPASAGIVRDILVREGDEVERGQVLVRLDPTETAADNTAIERELAIQTLQIRRIDSELRNKPLARMQGDDDTLLLQVEAQRRAHRQSYLDSLSQEQAVRDRAEKELGAAREVLRKLEKTQPSYQRSAEAYEKLAGQKLIGELQAEEMRRAAIENAQDLEAQRSTVAGLQAAVAESDRRLAQLSSAYESDLHVERMAAVSRLNQLEQQQVKAKFQRTNLELRAPQTGRVKELATTTLGAVVQPGTVLVSLVPKAEPLLAEVMIDNQDIGFVHPGQSVRLKLAAYPFQRYGMLAGSVKTIIADSQDFANKRQEVAASTASESGVASTTAFKATIVLQNQQLQAGDRQLPLAAGMQLSAEIVQDRRTVLQYLLSPLQRVVSEAGNER